MNPTVILEGETISTPILQMEKLSLRKDVLAQEHSTKNQLSQDLNPDLPTCICPTPVGLAETFPSLFPPNIFTYTPD